MDVRLLSTMTSPTNFDPAAHPRKLNLGCGWDHRAGYVNVDLHEWHKPDIVADIRKLDFMPSNYYEEIVAQDVLEHLPRTATVPTLEAWNRLLKIGGLLAIRVPSILGLADLLRDKANAAPAKQEWLIQCLFGTQAYTGDFHYTSFTEISLRHQLELAGLRLVDLKLFHGWLFDAVAEKVRHIETPSSSDFSHLLEESDDLRFVERCYAEILQREPDDGGRSFFLQGLNAGMGRNEVIQVMVGSAEYREKKLASASS